MNISSADLSWLAGLLEGEGSFMMSRNHVAGRVYHYPKVVVTMTDEDVVQRAASLFETKVNVVSGTKKENRLQQYRAQISGSRAAQLMKDLLPHMGGRRSAKIQEILAAYGEIEPTSVRRARSCSESAKKRWAQHGTRTGRLDP